MNSLFSLSPESSEKMPVAFYQERIIQRKLFLSHVFHVCKMLPGHKYCINLCDNRYHFLVTFAACAALKQISLLPGSRAEKEVERLRENYSDHHLVNDYSVEKICQSDDVAQGNIENIINFEAKQIVAVVFTSGSTGIPKPNPKTWEQLYESAYRVKNRFKINDKKQHSIIATVPPQHMFGFETSIVYPLVLGVAIHAGQPFYPLDIQKALSEMSAPHILITTPLHLKTCVAETRGWPDLDFIISATAPLEVDIANEAEKVLNTSVFEIYGCSEAGAIATRRLFKSKNWFLLEDYHLVMKEGVATLLAPGYQEPVKIPDFLEVYDDNHFKLLARDNDLINMGGKRGSLGDLSNKLRSIDGVIDGVFILPDETKGKRTRLAAFVVTKQLDVKKIRKDLAKLIDSVFLPRPLIILERLPYNDIGKLSRDTLIKLLNQHLIKNEYRDIA